jgi:hypothetical protein
MIGPQTKGISRLGHNIALRLMPEDLAWLDEFCDRTFRSRSDAMRWLIAHARLTLDRQDGEGEP